MVHSSFVWVLSDKEVILTIFFLNLKTKICLIFIIFLTIKCTIIRTNKKVSHNHSCLKTDISEEYLIFSCMFHFEKGLIWLNRHTHAASLQTTPLITRLAPVIAIFIRKLQGIAYGINVKKKIDLTELSVCEQGTVF